MNNGAGEYQGPAFLYAMRRAVDGAIKIGVSRNPQLRVIHLINAFRVLQINPSDIELIEWVFLKTPRLHEKDVHDYLIAGGAAGLCEREGAPLEKLRSEVRPTVAPFLGAGTTREWFHLSDSELARIFRIFRKWPEALAS